MNVDLIVSIYLDRGSTPLGSIILQKNRLILVNKAIFSILIRNLSKQKAYLSVGLSDDPYGTRTRVTAVKGRCLNRLTNGPL